MPLAHLDGLDSLLPIVSMPAGVPVATVAVAVPATPACSRSGSSRPATRRCVSMVSFQADLRAQALAKGAALRERATGADS